MMIPMTAFDIPEDVFLGSMDLVVTIFWTVDIILTFFIGFYDKGILEMRPMPVAKRYFKSWFCTDILVVSTDWLVVGLEDAASSTEGSVLGIMRIGKSVRILRVLRMFRPRSFGVACVRLLSGRSVETISMLGRRLARVGWAGWGGWLGCRGVGRGGWVGRWRPDTLGQGGGGVDCAHPRDSCERGAGACGGCAVQLSSASLAGPTPGDRLRI